MEVSMAKLKTAVNQVIVKKLNSELELYDDNIGDDPMALCI